MRKVWVVVANRSNANIFISEKDVPFVLYQKLEHPESHLQEHELVSDKKGKEANQNLYGTSTFEPSTTAVKKESLKFAKEIASFLTSAFQSHAFDRLYLVAPSPFIAELREALPALVKHCVYQEIPKNLVHLEAKELREYLPPVL